MSSEGVLFAEGAPSSLTLIRTGSGDRRIKVELNIFFIRSFALLRMTMRWILRRVYPESFGGLRTGFTKDSEWQVTNAFPQKR